MAVKKKAPLEEEAPSLFEDGDYFVALVKVKGKREPVKIRGMINQVGNYGYELYNNQHGKEVDCDENDDFDFRIDLDGNTQSDLDKAGIVEFSVVTDKRIIKVIDNDRLPDIGSFSARRTADGDITFGCGAVTFSKEDISVWLDVSTKLRKLKGWEKFNEMNEEILEEMRVDELNAIDLDDVKKLIQ